MLQIVQLLLKRMQPIISMIFSFGLALLLLIQPAIALTDGQQLVLEAWSLVNEGYLEPQKLDDVQWRRLRQRALEKPITTSFQAYAAIDAMVIRLDDPYTRLIRPKDYEALKASNLGSEINGVGLQLGLRNEDNQIVVISSFSGCIGLPNRTAYCASKFAVNGFFESLRTELK